MSIPDVPDIRTARGHGPYSAYCRLCWNPVYKLWIQEDAPDGKCQFGREGPHCCPDAINRARNAATIKALVKA